MAQFSGVNILKTLITGTGQHQKELIEQYKDLVQTSPQEATQMLSTILKIIRQEQIVRIISSLLLIGIVGFSAVLLLLDNSNLLASDMQMMTRENIMIHLGNLENKPLLTLEAEDSQIAVRSDSFTIGYVRNSRVDDFITLKTKQDAAAVWYASMNNSDEIKDELKLERSIGTLSSTEYPGYEKGIPYKVGDLEDFWFKIEEVDTPRWLPEKMAYKLRFGEGASDDISWHQELQVIVNTNNGEGNLVAKAPSVLQKADWNRSYVISHGIGKFVDNRVYKLNIKAYGFNLEVD